MKLYLAGPMTGIEDYNYPAFNAAANMLRERGHFVINPAESEPPEHWQGTAVWSDYLRHDIAQYLTERIEAIAVLPGWRKSKGAQLETYVARSLGYPIYRVDDSSGNGLSSLFTVVGLSGYARSGKDTAAQYLAQYGFERVAFADGVRTHAYRLNPTVHCGASGYRPLRSVVDELGWDKAKAIEEVRAILQRIGTDQLRADDPDYWVKRAFNQLEDGGKYVFTDTRFPNEAQAIKDHGGVMIRIHRPGFGPVNGHISEVALDDWPFDAMIENSGPIKTFQYALELNLDQLGVLQAAVAH